MNCFVYIDLNSPQRDPSESPKAGPVSSKRNSHQPKESEKPGKTHQGNSKKLTRSHHHIRDSSHDSEEKPTEKRIKLSKGPATKWRCERLLNKEKTPKKSGLNLSHPRRRPSPVLLRRNPWRPPNFRSMTT